MRTRRIRRNQTITPFSVGAIYDVRGESFVAADTSMWRGRPIFLKRIGPRIAVPLGITQLRTAPPAPDSKGYSTDPGTPFYRFPRWMFCPNDTCRRMVRWSLAMEPALVPGEPPRCGSCDGRQQLVPMRFVMICGNGHLDDVDWWRWAHSGQTGMKQASCAVRDALTFERTPGGGGGLESLFIRCSDCGARRNLHQIASPHTPRSIGWSCRGHQPWLPTGSEQQCDEDPVIVQRGASNVHFPAIASAIDIPPDSDSDSDNVNDIAAITAHPDFQSLLANPKHPLRNQLIGIIAQAVGVPEDRVVKVLTDQLGADAPSGVGAGVDFSQEQFSRDEWAALTISRSRSVQPGDDFVVEHTDLSNRQRPAATTRAADLLAGSIQHLVKVSRLREIRALRGFHRYTMKQMVPPDIANNLPWLPAIEVRGEGIFLALDEDSVREWEVRPGVSERVRPLEPRRERSFLSEFLPTLTPRFVMIHTLAHLLIRQLIYDSGYSSSAIRERLYVAGSDSPQPMAGLMVYTGEGDSEGTLGGLVRSGDPDWFLPTIITALHSAEWCSLDPVCVESTAQGVDSLSLAACHACALVAETSCTHSNSALDRSLLVDPHVGYFNSVLTATQTPPGTSAT